MASARTKIRVFSQDGTPLAEYLLGEGVHTMGRDPSSAIYLESDYVSSEHARPKRPTHRPLKIKANPKK